MIGKQIGKYYVIEEIAVGSCGTVYRACDIDLDDRIVALEVLPMPARECERFLNEAPFLKNLHHRHILSIVDMGFDNGSLYIASTYAPGGSLRDLLQRTHLLSWDTARIILMQVGEALQYAHQQNIVHCDLKPENILFNAQGEAVVADFSILALLSIVVIKPFDNAEDAPSYQAPEQLHGQVGKETDQYALGCIAYEMMTGKQLFSRPCFIANDYNHETKQSTSPCQIPIHVEEALLKALAKQRSARHQDVAAFLIALQTPLSLHVTKEKWLSKGNTLYILRRYEEALQAFEQAIQISPDDISSVDVYKSRGKALYRLHRFEEAVKAYEQALLLDPANGDVYNAKGDALSLLTRCEEAIKAYDQALRVGLNITGVFLKKALVLRRLRRYEEQLATYEQALLLEPNSTNIYSQKVGVLCTLKRYEEALAICEQAMVIDPNYIYIYDKKASILRILKRYEEALAICEEAILIDPNYIHIYDKKASILRILKRYEEALAICEEAILINPRCGYAYNEKGNVLSELERYEEALEQYEQSIHVTPYYTDAYNGKANILHELGRYEEALKLYEHVLQFNPDWAFVYDNKANTLVCLGRSSEAQEAREKARELGWS